MAGMSVSYIDNKYGVPGSTHGLDPNNLDGLELILPQLENLNGFEDVLGAEALYPDIRIDLQNIRYDFKGEWNDPIEVYTTYASNMLTWTTNIQKAKAVQFYDVQE